MTCVSDLRSEVEALSAKLHHVDSTYKSVSESQQQYEFICAKFNQKLNSVQAVTEEQITPEQGLTVMQERMTSLEVSNFYITTFLIPQVMVLLTLQDVCHLWCIDNIHIVFKELKLAEPQFLEQITRMEELSASFSPHLSEADKISVYNQITENTNKLRNLNVEVERQLDTLNTDIDEVCMHHSLCATRSK